MVDKRGAEENGHGPDPKRSRTDGPAAKPALNLEALQKAKALLEKQKKLQEKLKKLQKVGCVASVVHVYHIGFLHTCVLVVAIAGLVSASHAILHCSCPACVWCRLGTGGRIRGRSGGGGTCSRCTKCNGPRSNSKSFSTRRLASSSSFTGSSRRR